MATVGYASALGSIAKDAISGAGKGFVGGLKGAMMTEAPGLTGTYAFGQELKKRANAPRVSNNGTPSSNSPSSSGMGGGLGAGISIVAGQQKQSNVINLEQVRQLRQLNQNVVNQSKLIAFQVGESKRKDLFAEELANEQALRDEKLLNAIENLRGAGRGGKGGTTGGEADSEGLGASFVSGLVFKRILTTVISAVVRHPYVAGGLALGAGVAAAAAAAKNRPAPPSSTITGRDAQLDPQGAARRAADKQATGRTIPRPTDYVPKPGENRGYSQNQSRARQAEQQKWDSLNKGTHDPITGMPNNGIIMKPPATGVVTSKFGIRKDPKTGKDTQHNGIDIGMPNGTPVTPVAPGKVIKVGSDPVSGTYISVQHADGKISEYMHLSSTVAKINDAVTETTIIGKSGGAVGDAGAGKSTGPHLHLQIRDSATNKFIDPTSLPGLTHLVAGAKVKPTDSQPVLKAKPKEFNVKGYRPGNQLDLLGITPVEDYYKGLSTTPEGQPTPEPKSKTGLGLKTSSVSGDPILDQIMAAFSAPRGKSKFGAGIQLAAGPGFNFSGLFGGGGGGTEIKDDAPVSVHDKKAFEQNAKIAKAQGINTTNGSILNSKASSYGKALNTQSFKPLFRSNSDLLAQVNKTFLQQFRNTATAAFTQAITKGLFPKGVGVAFSQASQDDMYRGQQLQKIFGTSSIISSATTKLLGKQYGPMFAPLFDNLAQGYLEVGSRMAGKAIFQGIGGLDARESQGIMGQVLGNYAAGNKKLALEQLLFGASGGAKSGIALGPETLFAKYGFANPMEGISYFASALGERATQPFAKLMGADDRDKSVIFDPRTKKYVYADTGAPASQADVNAANAGYGSRVSQTPMFGPGMNNYGMPGAPYQTTAGVGGTYQINNSGAYQQILNAKQGQEISRAQAFGLTDQEQARGGAKLIAEQNTMLRAQGETQNRQLEQQRKLAEEDAKRQFDLATKQAATEAEMASAQAAYDKALNEAKTSTDRVDTDRVIAKLDQVGGKASGGGTAILDKDGNPVNRRSGQLFDSNVYKDGRVVGSDPMKEIGNFAFDMGKNMLGQKLTQNIKNPYMQMVANFAIQKGLNFATDYLFKSGGIGDTLLDAGGSFIMDTALPAITSFFGFADGGVVTKATPGVFGEAGAEAIIPLANPNATKALSAAMGTDKTLASLGDQTQLLTSIDGSLRVLSGGGSGSGTSYAYSGSGMAWDVGLGGGGSSGGGGSPTINGVARSRATQQKPSTMDYVSAIGGSILKSFVVNKAIGAASTALFGATPGVLAGNALISAGFPTLGTMLGGTVATGTGLTAGAAGVTGLTAGGSGIGLTAGSASLGGSLGTTVAAVETGVGASAATSAAAAGSTGGIGASLAAAAPYALAAIAVFMIIDSYGGGGSSPPPKEPKFHAAIYVAGNNNVNAITPMYETRDYHAVPDVYKTIAYGLLRVAFNATKSSEQVTKIAPPYDFVYMKVQFDKISMVVGKGAPSLTSLQADSATDVLSWPAPSEGTNLNTLARDIIHWVRDEFKKVAKDENLGKLDKAASALGSYSLDEISRGLIPDLTKGKYALDKNVEKGIYANNVAESNRISSLINAAAANPAYTTAATADSYEFDPNDTDYRNGAERKLVKGDPGGVPMIYSMKQGKFVVNTFGSDAILLDHGDRPVYNIEGTSAGLSVEDFVSASAAGTARPANILADTATGGSSGGGTTNVTTVTGPKVDNSAVTNYYNTLSTVVDPIRSTASNVG